MGKAMTDQFKNIKRLGLDLKTFDNKLGVYVRADDLEKLLSAAPVVDVYGWVCGSKRYWRTPNISEHDGTHTAILVGITPIVKDTADSLLREYLEKFAGERDMSIAERYAWVIRVRALIEGESK